MAKSKRREIWLYERFEDLGDGGIKIHPHLYVCLSDEHPIGAGGVYPAKFVEDVYTSSAYQWRRIEQGEAFLKLHEGYYRYVNYSERAIDQEWQRPVFASKKVNHPKYEHLLWSSFKKQLACYWGVQPRQMTLKF